jgi:very-short-patch-repair endonuclease
MYEINLQNIDNNNYPIIILPENLVNSLDKTITIEDICNNLGIIYPKFDYYIYPDNKFDIFFNEKKKIHINEIINEFNDLNSDYLENVDYFFYFKKLPKKPKQVESKEKKETDWILIKKYFYFLTLVTVVSFMIFSIELSIILLFLLIIIPIVYNGGELPKHTIIEKINLDINYYEKEKEKYIKEVEKIYLEEKQKIEKIINETNEIANKNKTKIEEEIFKNLFKPLIRFEIKINNKKGKTENYFFEKLKLHFGNQIYINVVPNEGINPYQPDFLLICKETGFHIDIEIDEPYTTTNEIIHYEQTNDFERNEYFISINWGIIRFTEKQIIESSDNCCFLIASLLESLRNKKKIFSSNLKKDKKWNYSEGVEMCKNDYRNSYLPYNLRMKNIENNDFEIPF